MMRSAAAVALVVTLTIPAAAAQELARARQLAEAGQRQEALSILEGHLAEHPSDNDARTLYGLILSWDRQYDRARAELRRVLASDPGNEDARQALANVERWDPRMRNEITAGFQYDDYDDGSDWQEAFTTWKRGALIGRIGRGSRFGLHDAALDVEIYPHLAPKTYAYLAAGLSSDGTLYPDWRAGAELFHAFGNGYEASAGLRHLHFDDAVAVYTASLAKYAGNWYLAGRGYFSDDSSNGQLLIRRYFADRSYAGIRIGTGREEIRSAADIETLDQREAVAELRWQFERAHVEMRAGGGSERRTALIALGWRF
jgi:YaiO family outer membrane protein